MTYAPGPFTVVAREDRFDEDTTVEWCGHWHENGDEANECPWNCTAGLFECIVHQDYFDPSCDTPCVHELHPSQCLRCLELECIHLNDPDECERCYAFRQFQTSEPRIDDDVFEGPVGSGESDQGGTGNQRPVDSEEAA